MEDMLNKRSQEPVCLVPLTSVPADTFVSIKMNSNLFLAVIVLFAMFSISLALPTDMTPRQRYVSWEGELVP